jgi:hypothetical protein
MKGNKPGPTMGHTTLNWQDKLLVLFGSNGRTMTNRVYTLDPHTFGLSSQEFEML